MSAMCAFNDVMPNDSSLSFLKMHEANRTAILNWFDEKRNPMFFPSRERLHGRILSFKEL